MTSPLEPTRTPAEKGKKIRLHIGGLSKKEISAMADDTLKFERIVAWCASHPHEVPFALHQLLGRNAKASSEPASE